MNANSPIRYSRVLPKLMFPRNAAIICPNALITNLAACSNERNADR